MGALPLDEEMLTRSFADNRAEMIGLARRALGGAHQAEEAVQETFVRAWRSRDGFDPTRGSLRPWLFSIERNLLIDMARSRARSATRDARLEQETEPVVDDIEKVMASWQVEEAVGQLSPEHRTVVLEIYFRGKTSKEMADQLAIPEGTVRTRLFYALKALKLTLEEMGWGA